MWKCYNYVYVNWRNLVLRLNNTMIISLTANYIETNAELIMYVVYFRNVQILEENLYVQAICCFQLSPKDF